MRTPEQDLRLTRCSGTGAATGILRMTHHEKIQDFSGKMRPEVLLSYTTTIANSSMGFAYAEAAVIGFWNNALEAMPASNLHYYWAGSSSPLGAIRSISLYIYLFNVLVPVIFFHPFLDLLRLSRRAYNSMLVYLLVWFFGQVLNRGDLELSLAFKKRNWPPFEVS
ncbi:hypothetical protein QBC32DRAFT_351434 [Pseudoneurospora amorphoporcata]|uniref:Uncharacterized protein n=1 Tax=Pseudoneurospora amorphoporcata TaxID=241081 RepID=A0AAN6NMD4_9PEZI|nr:hypothetical protein QBC32DRAFT_351434 [Pseudoneurospora amorphoporcata]